MVKRIGRVGPLARVSLLVLLAGVACNAIIGADEPTIVDQERCAVASDCSQDGNLCVLGLCAPPCSGDGDCASGQRCLKGTAAPTGACVKGAAVKCEDEGDCPGVPICSKGECRNDCGADPSSCLEGQVCGADGACYGTSDDHDPMVTPTGTGGAGGRSGTGGTSSAGRGGTGGSGGGSAGSAGQSAGAAGEETGGAAGMGSGQSECEEDGAIRCAGHATTGRLICDDGVLRLHDTCPDGELCDSSSEPPGECAKVPAQCRGRSPGEAFCEGSVRSVCGEDLVSVDETECDSVQLCTLGSGPDCAVCLPNTYRCLDTTLQECNSDNTGFTTIAECTTEPCNPDAGACTTHACLKGQKRCTDDELERCKVDQSGFELDTPCGVGLCDQGALECDECVAGTKRCVDGGSFATCDADGQGESPGDCLEPLPVCTGAGLCVGCTQATDCAPADACHTRSCNTGSGTCEYPFNGVGATCNGDDLCNAAGDCVACLSVDDCPSPDDCHPAQCTSAGACQAPQAPLNTPCDFDGGRFCNASGACVDCTNGGQCSSPDDCHPASCSSGQECQAPQAPVDTPCNDNGGKYCDSGGACVGCTSATQCMVSGECWSPSCSGGGCGQSAKVAGVGCSGGKYCDGAGGCVTCYGSGQAQCMADSVCRTGSCVSGVHTAGWELSTAFTSSLSADVLYLKRMPPLAYPATLRSFGIVGTATGSSAKLALYADNPATASPTGSALAEASTALAATPREVNASPMFSLSAGVYYWIGFKLSNAATLKAGSGSVPGEQVSAPYTDGFPAFSGTAIAGSFNTEIAVYIKVLDTQ